MDDYGLVRALLEVSRQKNALVLPENGVSKFRQHKQRVKIDGKIERGPNKQRV